MTNGQAAVLGERVAVLETKIDASTEAMKAISDKLDTLIEGQADGKRDRAELRSMIEAMKPDVATVADIKRAGKFGAWIVGILASVVAAIATAKGWIMLNWNWFIGR